MADINTIVNTLGQLEPGRQFLGKMQFTDSGPLLVHKFNLSNIETSPIEVRQYAEPTYFPGHIVPGTIDAEVYFFPDKLKAFIDKFFGTVYDVNTGHLGPSSIKTDIFLQVLNPDGTVMMTVTLKNCWITSLDFGDVDWGSNDIIIVTMSIVYEKIDGKIVNIK
jgi:hypothetical protein